jgi:hypothetical protein
VGGASEDFRKTFGGDHRGHLLRGTSAGATVSSLVVDEADPNRSNAFGAARGKDFFPLRMPPLAVVAFSVGLSLELLEMNFLLGFRALARANSWADV